MLMVVYEAVCPVCGDDILMENRKHRVSCHKHKPEVPFALTGRRLVIDTESGAESELQ